MAATVRTFSTSPRVKTVAEELARLEWLADLLDSRFRIPGTNIRFGLDPVIGLVPIAGDFIGMVIGLYIMVELADLGLPRWTRFRMLFNIAMDFFVGSIPVAGDTFDVFFRSNRMNIALARRVLKKKGKI